MTALLLRLFLGVKFVSDRLQQDAVYFESGEHGMDMKSMGERSTGEV